MRAYTIALASTLAATAACIGSLSAEQSAPEIATLAPPKADGGQVPAAKEDESKRLLPANPLWAMPLRDLTATRNRPLFSPSRRPPAPPALLAAPPPPPKVVAAPREPDHPPLALVGTVVSETLSIAIFREEATKETTRLKTGEDYRGWSLRSVSPREVEFQGPSRNAVLSLPPPQAGTPQAGVTQGHATGIESDGPARHRTR